MTILILGLLILVFWRQVVPFIGVLVAAGAIIVWRMLCVLAGIGMMLGVAYTVLFLPWP